MLKKIGTKTLLLGQSKINHEEKRIYMLKGNHWVISYSGSLAGFKNYLKALEKNENRKERRAIISDLCGTSAKQACKDMGISY